MRDVGAQREVVAYQTEAFINSGSLGKHYHQNFRHRNAKRIE
jgi:hypothetical protein